MIYFIRLMRSSILPAIALVLVAGCGAGAQLTTPNGFGVLDDQKEYVYRATSPDGVVLAIRGEPNELRANLEFWADALDRKLRNQSISGSCGPGHVNQPQCYVADGEPTAARSSAGIPGKQLRYTITVNGRPHRYWLTVFVTEGKVWMVEAGGDKDRFTGKTEEAVKKAIESFTLN